MPKTVAAVLIVKNEEALLARCLESVKGLPIYILDTGSTDRTIEIARQYTENAFLDYVWIDNFSDAQNHVKAKVKEDFILSIDADEVLLSSVDEVIAAAQSGKDMIRVSMIPESLPNMAPGEMFGFGRLFRNSPDIFWVSSIHKHLNLPGEGEPIGNLKIMYGRSPAHNLDPERSLRMLEAAVGREESLVRNLYYLGREYYYFKRFQDAIDTFKRYFPLSERGDELADAYLIAANSYLELAARDPQNQDPVEHAAAYVLQAIKINANFREAIELMAAMALPESRLQWKRMARAATNEGILWKRLPTERSDDVILISVHNDDESIFAAATLMRVKPLVVVVTDSWTQHLRGDRGCGPEARKQETIEAMKLAGCPVLFMGIPDEKLTEELLSERLKHFNPARVYAPAIQGGNAQHDLVGKVAMELFGDRCERYTTYNKTELYTKGNFEIKLTDEELELKQRMLACYKSQLQFEWQVTLFNEWIKNPSEWLL